MSERCRSFVFFLTNERTIFHRVVACLMALCDWSKEKGYEALHLYCLATLFLLAQVHNVWFVFV